MLYESKKPPKGGFLFIDSDESISIDYSSGLIPDFLIKFVQSSISDFKKLL